MKDLRHYYFSGTPYCKLADIEVMTEQLKAYERKFWMNMFEGVQSGLRQSVFCWKISSAMLLVWAITISILFFNQ